MTDTITAGSLWVEKGTHLPAGLLLQGESYSSGWALVKDGRPGFEKALQNAGWTFFFMAGEIKTTVFGFDKQKALRTALKRLISDVQCQHCNSIEITTVVSKSFVGMPYVNVSAHLRHLQKGSLFAGNGKTNLYGGLTAS